MVSQVYPPDPAAVGQYLADAAQHLADRGHTVWVLTADRGYDDPSQHLVRYEQHAKVRILRLPLSSLGKKSVGLRVVGGLSLVAQASLFGLLWPGVTDVLLSTSPPVGALAGLALHALRGLPFDYWLMDLNPDEAVTFGHAKANGPGARLLDAMNRAVLKRARHIVALDRPMADRFGAKLEAHRTIRVLPPWPLGWLASKVPSAGDGGKGFRRAHGLEGNRVLMYSGNHSLVHPLDTLVRAAQRFDRTSALRFVFVGGGAGKRPIDDWVSRSAPGHVLSLPYQPLDKLHDTLSAADVQVTIVGPDTVSLVHPSKLYGALAVGKPVLVIGPSNSPAAELVLREGIGWQVEHGQSDALERLLRQVEIMPGERLAALGAKARALAEGSLSREVLLNRFCTWLEEPPDSNSEPASTLGG
jgi:hypothetical protein